MPRYEPEGKTLTLVSRLRGVVRSLHRGSNGHEAEGDEADDFHCGGCVDSGALSVVRTGERSLQLLLLYGSPLAPHKPRRAPTSADYTAR